jgi:hypothetical protein
MSMLDDALVVWQTLRHFGRQDFGRMVGNPEVRVEQRVVQEG